MKYQPVKDDAVTYRGRRYTVDAVLSNDRVRIVDESGNAVTCHVTHTQPAVYASKTSDSLYEVGQTVKYCENKYVVESRTTGMASGARYGLRRVSDDRSMSSIHESEVFEWTIRDDAREYVQSEKDALAKEIQSIEAELVAKKHTLGLKQSQMTKLRVALEVLS